MTDEMSLAVFDPFKALAVKVQEEDAALTIDHTTPEGEKELRSWVRTVRGYRAGLEKIRVRAKADALEYGRQVDGKAKELKVPFDTIITDRMKPLDEIEDAKLKAAEAIVEAERVAAERVETERLADLKRREDEVARKEAEQKDAEDAADAEQREAERVEREKRIAVEAAEKATKLAEANAVKKAEDLRKAIQDNTDRKERIRIEESEAKAAVERMDAEVERRRVADKEHREKIEKDIDVAIDRVLTENLPNRHVTQAHALADAIRNGDIPHVTINY